MRNSHARRLAASAVALSLWPLGSLGALSSAAAAAPAPAAAPAAEAGKTIPAPPDVAAPPADAEVTPSGLASKVLQPGTGSDHPLATDKVKVHYRGTLTDGTVFDSSIDRGEPVTFPLSGVIPCWTQGLQLMKTGGKARLVCPSELAYGDAGSPPKIKGGATLVFEVELLSIEK
jgi:FKBP-type peptidyl-prolyl cis-trans isomerase